MTRFLEYDNVTGDIAQIDKYVNDQRLYRPRVTQKENCTGVMNEYILNLHLGCWNIEGLSKYESSVELADFVKGIDIFGFCETWGQNVSQFDTFVDGFQPFSVVRKKRYRKGRPSGGVTVFVKYNLIEKG